MSPQKKLAQEVIENFRNASKLRRLQKQSLLAARQVADPAVQQTGGRILIRLYANGKIVSKSPLPTALLRQSRIRIPEFKFHRKSVAEK